MTEEGWFYVGLFIMIILFLMNLILILEILSDRFNKKMDTTYDVCDYVNEYYERNISGMINVLEDCFYGGAVDELCEAIG